MHFLQSRLYPSLLTVKKLYIITLIKKNRHIFNYLPPANARNKIVFSFIISNIGVYATHVKVYHSLRLATATWFELSGEL